MKPSLRVVCIAFPLVACGTQETQETQATLPPPVAIAAWASRVDTLAGTYTRVVGPAEFQDSILIVPDVGEKLMWRINLNTGSKEAFGRQGGGPGEYERVGWVGTAHADSVIVFQGFGLAPFPVIDVNTGRGRTHRAIAGNANNDRNAIILSVSEPMFRSSDTLGAMYGSPMLAPAVRDSVSGVVMPPTGAPDTAPIVRYVIRTGDVDTLLRYPTGRSDAAVAPELIRQNIRPLGLGAYGPFNDWHVMRGGDLLAADAASYTLRVRPANGGDVREFTLPFNRVAVSDSGWEAYVAETTKGSKVLLEKTMRDMSEQLGKSMAAPMPTYLVPEKPSHLPPVNFGGGVKRMHSAGRIAWIPVHRAEPPLYDYWDLVDIDQGVRLTTLELPPNHRLLHVSSLGAYVAAKDEDDLERILLYRP